MARVSVRDMLAAGVHFGHQRRYWNPKMKEYIYGDRNRVSIINLDKTAECFDKALAELERVAARKGKILFVGTKRAASEAVKAAAEECGQFFVNHSWKGGTLTNWKTVRNSIEKLRGYEEDEVNGTLDKLTKKEAISRTKLKDKLNNFYGGIKNMNGLPDLLFVVSAHHDEIAIAEARNLGIPVVAVCDTNTNPDGVDFVIPGNDDAAKAIQLYLAAAVEAVKAGKEKSKAAAEAAKAE